MHGPADLASIHVGFCVWGLHGDPGDRKVCDCPMYVGFKSKERRGV